MKTEVNKKTNVVELNKDQQESLRILFSVAEKHRELVYLA